MFVFTPQERKVVALCVLTILTGMLLRSILQHYPSLSNIVNVIDSDLLYSKVNINTATFDELVAIPFIGTYTASNIINYRREHGPFTRLDQLQSVKGIREKNYQKFIRYLVL